MFGFGGGSGWQRFCAHQEDACECYLNRGPKGVTQTLDELEFTRSACSAAQQGDTVKLERILSRNPTAAHNDGTNGSSGYTPLHYAARGGHVAAVQLLLKYGAVVDAATREGKSTALHRCAGQGHLNVVKLLLAAGADPMNQDSDGETALHKAAAGGHTEVCAFLLSAGGPALAEVTDKYNRTASERLRGNKTASFVLQGGQDQSAVFAPYSSGGPV